MALHPQGRRTDVKVSTGTRCPRTALNASRLLISAGQALLASASLKSMRYEEIRAHAQEYFRGALRRFKEGIAEGGPKGGSTLEALRNSQALAEGSPEDWVDMYPGGLESLLRAFCEAQGIPLPDGDETRRLLLVEMHKGNRAFVSEALAYNSSLDSMDIRDGAPAADRGQRPLAPVQRPVRDAPVAAPGSGPLELDGDELDRGSAPRSGGAALLSPAPEESSDPEFNTVRTEHLSEIERHGGLAPKTLGDRRDALELLSEITGNKPVAQITKADARQVKSVLIHLPKNRKKSPETAGLSLADALKVPNTERLATRTVNAYLGNLQTFFKWAVDNGHAAENVFSGMRVKAGKATAEKRDAFTPEQMRTLVQHLTGTSANPFDPVPKDTHKWVTLIAVYTGMRLNEVAQLLVADVKCDDDVWYFNVTEVVDPGTENAGAKKRLKNSSSERKVPVHARLLELGLLAFVESRINRHGPKGRAAETGERLFHDLPYCPKNGYGRNVGRWFNDKLLPALDMNQPGLVFHSLRHTVTTRLAQSGVPEAQIKAILGHAQAGVTFNTYFKEGFLPSQLRDAINRLAF